MYEIELLTPEGVKENWPVLCELLGKAVAHNHGEMEVDDIPELVENRRMFVSVLRKDGEIVLAIAGEIMKYPREKVLNVSFAGGKDGKLVADHMWSHLEGIASVFNVAYVRAFCRPSMVRYLQQTLPGVECIYTVVQKRIGQ